ncbi:hypothetical protein EXT46_05275 [Pseudoalteromonas sp. CO325X]|uniref:hypothetical protein n=1 Tax=Pseudoalteromonas sp. CO325X TaxID=1777262 RepID=UPI001022BA44|nr:hypothetical protein [Pseudoalteromonas sp. CO325X]RZF83705.1 hypothetical protein EXT46_05275 [Pseudoalteromonas sp. CO325X]
MNKKLRMLILNEADNAELSLANGVELATLPLSNLQRYSNSHSFRSTTLSNLVIAGNLADIQLLTALVLWRHNLSNAATWKLELFDGPHQSGERLYDSGNINVIPQITLNEWNWQTQPIIASSMDSWSTRFTQHWLKEALFAKSFRITIDDPTNPDGFIDITRLYCGHHFEPTFNFSYGHELGFGTHASSERTDAGSIFSQALPTWRVAQFELSYIDEQDRPRLMNALRHVGLHRDWFISMFPGEGGQKESEYAFACKLTELPPATASHFNRYQMNFNVEEC